MVSKELITRYKCDRCGKQMDSQYAILTLKRAGCSLGEDDFINQDLCVDCFNMISAVMNDNEAMLITTANIGNYITAKDCMPKNSNIDYRSKDRPTLADNPIVTWNGANVTWTNDDVLNKHLNVTSV